MAGAILGSPESLSKRAALLRISTHTLAQSMQSGCFRSAFTGQGIEFSGVRDYIRGDDIRSIDWNVTARMGKPYVKMFEEERELQIFIIVDRSLSMNTGSKARSKLQTATEIAALLTMAAEQNQNPVGVVLFNGLLEFTCAPKNGLNQTMMLLTKLNEYPDKTAPGSVLGKAITGACAVLKKRSLVFVISDFRSTAWETPLAILASKHDVATVRITDPVDSSLPEMGAASFKDAESGEVRVLPTNAKNFRAAWYEDAIMHTKRFQETCAKRGALTLNVSTTDDCLTSLLEFFGRRKA
jgi:uncharacterized protein (DUF58 family)